MNKFISIGTDQILADLEQPIKNNGTKPIGGLWASPYYPEYPNYNPWMEYMLNNIHILFYKRHGQDPFNIPAAVITLNDNANIFQLANIDALNFLKQNYPTPDGWIDFEKMALDFDGIYIDVNKLRFSASNTDNIRIDRFGVNSLLLFNLTCINYYQKSLIVIEPFDFTDSYDYITYDIKVDINYQHIDQPNPKINELIAAIKKLSLEKNESIEQIMREKYSEILTNYFANKNYNTNNNNPSNLLLSRIYRSI